LIRNQDRNEFIEHPRLGSEAIDRIAVNYKSQHVAVRHQGTQAQAVYRYKNVSTSLIAAVCDGRDSMGQIVSRIKEEATSFTQSAVFPPSHLLFRGDRD
jgi:hypothetical protein